jgi:hypothetical protein
VELKDTLLTAENIIEAYPIEDDPDFEIAADGSTGKLVY